jgi:hypothetical protein
VWFFSGIVGGGLLVSRSEWLQPPKVSLLPSGAPEVQEQFLKCIVPNAAIILKADYTKVCWMFINCSRILLDKMLVQLKVNSLLNSYISKADTHF